jgi:hypothetical protein
MQDKKFNEIMNQLSEIFMCDFCTKSFFNSMYIDDLTEIELNFDDIFEILTLNQCSRLTRRITQNENYFSWER